MLNKPVNPSPIHTSIDATKDNILSCEVLNSQIAGSQFYVYGDRGNIRFQTEGVKTKSGLSCVLPSNNKSSTVSNGGEFSWDVVYWSELPSTPRSTVKVLNEVKAKSTSIRVEGSALCTANGLSGNTGGGVWYTNGFYSHHNETTSGYVYLLRPSDEASIKIGEGIDLIFRDSENATVAKVRGTSIAVADIYDVRNRLLGKCWKIGVKYDVYGYFPNTYSVAYVSENNGTRFEIHRCKYCAIYKENTPDFSTGDIVLLDVPHKILNITPETDGTVIQIDTPLLSAVAKDTVIEIAGKDQMDYTTSPEYYFRTRSTPKFSILSNDVAIYKDVLTLCKHFCTFNIYYNGKGVTGANLGEYQIVISALDEKNKHKTIYKSDIIYNPILDDSKFTFTYDGFASNRLYTLEVNGKTTEGDTIIATQYTFKVDYKPSATIFNEIKTESRNGYTNITMTNPWEASNQINKDVVIEGKTEEEIQAIEKAYYANGYILVVFRKGSKDLSLQKVCEIPLKSLTSLGGFKNLIKDYNVASKDSYTYYFALKDNEGYRNYTFYESEPVSYDFDEWLVIGLTEDDKDGYNVDNTNVWSFGVNTSASAYKHNYDRMILEGFNKYAMVGIGNRDYVDFTLSAFIGDIGTDNEYHDDIDIVNSWADFCSSANVKLYKEPKGRIMLVETTAMQDENGFACNENPTTISANFVQIGDTHNVPIYTWELSANG